MTLKKVIVALAVMTALVFGGVFSAYAVTYVHDSLNRLTQVQFDDGSLIQYTYDDIGNPMGKNYCGSQYLPITVTSGSGGTVSPSSASVACGGSQAFTITPDTGYSIASVFVDGTGEGTITSDTFSDVTTSHAISASFAINTYTVTPSAGAGGAISPSNAQTVSYD